MGILSKLANRFPSLPYNCYEIGHPLTESCSENALAVFISSLQQSFALYSVLYGLRSIASGKATSAQLISSLLQVTRSSLFLSFNVYFYAMVTCQQYHLFGVFRTITPLLSGLLSSFLAIYLEKKSRRKLLALYMLNLATETLYRTMWTQWQVRSLVPYFDVILYMASLAAYVYRATSVTTQDPILRSLEYLLGPREAHQVRVIQRESLSPTSARLPFQQFQYLLSHIRSWFANPPVHTQCSSNLCLQQAVYSGGRALVLGWLATTIMSIPKLIRGQSIHLLSRKSLGLSAFLFGTSAGTNLGQCLFQKFLPPHIARTLALLLSASSIAFYRSNSISIYIFFRAVELYFTGTESNDRGEVRRQRNHHFIEILYALSCAVVFYGIVFQPQNVRRSYVTFLDRLTGSKLSQINRHPLEMYGFKSSSSMFIDYFPQELNIERVSPKFLEMVLIWSLQ